MASLNIKKNLKKLILRVYANRRADTAHSVAACAPVCCFLTAVGLGPVYNLQVTEYESV